MTSRPHETTRSCDFEVTAGRHRPDICTRAEPASILHGHLQRQRIPSDARSPPRMQAQQTSSLRHTEIENRRSRRWRKPRIQSARSCGRSLPLPRQSEPLESAPTGQRCLAPRLAQSRSVASSPVSLTCVSRTAHQVIDVDIAIIPRECAMNWGHTCRIRRRRPPRQDHAIARIVDIDSEPGELLPCRCGLRKGTGHAQKPRQDPPDGASNFLTRNFKNYSSSANSR